MRYTNRRILTIQVQHAYWRFCRATAYTQRALYHAMARSSIRLSLSVTRVDRSKTVEVPIMQ